MADVLLPLLGNSTKSLIVKKIIENEELTLKELYNLVTRESKKAISYQAVHKSVQELIKEGILKKNDKIYLNEKWLNELSNFIAKASSKKEDKLIIEQKTVEQYKFTTFLDAAKFTLRFFDEIPNPEKKKGVCICKHSWPLFGVSPKDYELLSKILEETKFYEIIEHETRLDKAFGEALIKLGKEVKFGAKIETVGDIVVKGNYVLQIIYSEQFENQFDTLFKKYNSIDELPINNLIENFSLNKTEITAHIIKDKNYAEKLRKEVLKEFDVI